MRIAPVTVCEVAPGWARIAATAPTNEAEVPRELGVQAHDLGEDEGRTEHRDHVLSAKTDGLAP